MTFSCIYLKCWSQGKLKFIICHSTLRSCRVHLYTFFGQHFSKQLYWFLYFLKCAGYFVYACAFLNFILIFYKSRNKQQFGEANECKWVEETGNFVTEDFVLLNRVVGFESQFWKWNWSFLLVKNNLLSLSFFLRCQVIVISQRDIMIWLIFDIVSSKKGRR